MVLMNLLLLIDLLLADVSVMLVFSRLDSFPGDFGGPWISEVLTYWGPMDGLIDGWTDGQTDRASYGDAGSHLKRTK